MIVHSGSPDGYIVFYPYNDVDTRGLLVDLMKVKEVVVKDDIVSISTNKPKGAIGSWTCTLTSNLNYKSLLRPGTWCLIYLSDQQLTGNEGGDPDSGLKMIGIVRSVRTIENFNEGDGTRTVQYVISGEDFHFALNNHVYVNEAVRGTKGASNDIISAVTIFGSEFDGSLKSPDKVAVAILNSCLGFQSSSSARVSFPLLVPQEIPTRLQGSSLPQGRFSEFLQRFLQSDLIGQIGLRGQISGQFTVWSLLMTYAHGILNELYTELLPVQTDSGVKLLPSIVLRAIPFNTPDKSAEFDKGQVLSMLDGNDRFVEDDISTPNGTQLYVSKFITEDTVKGLNLGLSDLERFNFFLVTPNQGGAFGEAAFLGSLGLNLTKYSDPNSIRRYSLQGYITNTNYDPNATPIPVSVMVNDLVKDMWEDAHLYENGQVTINGTSEHVPVGTNIVFQERGWLGHVEAVAHNYQVSGGVKTYRTTLTLSRLQLLNGTPLGAAEDLSGQRGDWDRGVSRS